MSTAQACDLPATMSTADCDSPLTCAGVWRVVVELSPSWPAPFDPKHDTDPDDNNAQVNSSPVARTSAEEPRLTRVGVALSVVVRAWPI